MATYFDRRGLLDREDSINLTIEQAGDRYIFNLTPEQIPKELVDFIVKHKLRNETKYVQILSHGNKLLGLTVEGEIKVLSVDSPTFHAVSI